MPSCVIFPGGARFCAAVEVLGPKCRAGSSVGMGTGMTQKACGIARADAVVRVYGAGQCKPSFVCAPHGSTADGAVPTGQP